MIEIIKRQFCLRRKKSLRYIVIYPPRGGFRSVRGRFFGNWRLINPRLWSQMIFSVGFRLDRAGVAKGECAICVGYKVGARKVSVSVMR